ELIPKICAGMGIQERDMRNITCSQVPDITDPEGLCGAAIRVEYVAVTHSCDGVDLDGAQFREELTSDFLCTGRTNIAQRNGRVYEGNLFVQNPATDHYRDYYWACFFPQDIRRGTCDETYTQKIFIDDCLVATHRIIFHFRNDESGCSA